MSEDRTADPGPGDGSGAPVPECGVTAVVLAGGTSRRFGSDKLAAPLRGSTVLDQTLAGLPPDWGVVAVGEPRATVRAVRWTREDPPGGGPLAGIAAALDLVATDVVGVVAGDMPDAGPALADLVTALRRAPHEVLAVVATDPEGVANPLLAAYRVAAVRDVLPTPAHGRPARILLRLPHTEHAVGGTGAHGVDTPSDLADLVRAVGTEPTGPTRFREVFPGYPPDDRHLEDL